MHAENFEYELRHGLLPGRSGVFRVLAYTNYGNMGIYREAVAQFERHLVLRPDITNHPWHVTGKYGGRECRAKPHGEPDRLWPFLVGTMAKPNPSPKRK